MPNIYLSTVAEEKDKFNVKIKDWAVQDGPGLYKCKVCPLAKTNSFKKGKADLFKHSESEKHRRHFSSNNNSSTSQPSIRDLVSSQKKDDTLEKTWDLEITLCLFLANHGIQYNAVDCLVDILKEKVTDSEIIKNLKLGRTKAGYLINNGIADYYETETIDLLKKSNAFAVSLDESEVNKVSQLEILVSLACGDDDMLKDTRHFTSIDIENTKADTIKDALLDSLLNKEVNVKDKLINISTDNCPTMIGKHNGVEKKVQEVVPEVYATGQCNAHNIANTMKYAVESFDPDIKLACVNSYQDIGGAEGMGVKRKKEYEKSCREIGFNPKPLKKFIDVRFRTIRNCLGPLLHNYSSIAHFYGHVQKPTDRQKQLAQFFVDKRDMSEIKMTFINAATVELTHAIDFFESNDINVHNVGDKLESLMRSQMSKVLEEKEIVTLNEENDTFEKKSRRDLLKVDVDKAEILSNKKIFIGSDTEKLLKNLGLTPSSSQLKEFFDGVRRFHKTLVRRLQKYLSTALESSIRSNMSALSPLKQSHVATKYSLKSLANSYSKVIRNIDQEGMDKVRREIEEYIIDDDIKDIDKSLRYEDYWTAVSNLKEGEWQKYEVLPRFAMAISVVFNSNSEVERQFSLMNNVHQNKQRNCLSQESLNAILHVKSGVESSLVRRNCGKCQSSSSSDHCHCTLVDLSNIRDHCREARRKYFAAQTDAKANKENDSAEFNKRNEEFKEKEAKRIEKLREKLSRNKEFYKGESSFQSIFKPRYDEKRRASSDTGGNAAKKASAVVNNNTPTVPKKGKSSKQS